MLLGRSDERALVPFQPWIEALERLLEALPAADVDHWLTAHDGALARLLPARSAAQALTGGPRERYLAFELVRALLDDFAARWPVLLVLDDVHWADADSLSLLRHLARSAPRRRLLVVLCARPAELEPAVTQTLAELRREGPLVHVELAGLDDDAVAALLARRTGATDNESARRYRARSGGNPFFLDELLREAQEAGGDVERPPAGVRDVIARRLARLDDSTLRALDVAAVCGLEFDVTTLARVDDRPIVEVLEALDGATEAALVAATDRRGRYAFAHALVGETIVCALPASRRARLHLQIADVLAERHDAGDVGAGEVVRHLRAAEALASGDRLATWELAAAREATAALAHSEAAAHYEAALAVRSGAQDPECGEVLVALGHAHDRAGRRGQARAAFAEAAELARAVRDCDLLARAALGHGGTAVVIAAADPTAVRLLEEALAAAPADDLATSARLLARLSVELYYSDPARARDLSALAVERARRADDAAALAAALNAHRVALWFPHHADERLTAAGDMIAAAEAAGDREAVLQGRNWRVVDLLELGRVREAATEIDAYEALADAVALPHFRWYVPLWRATLALLAGRWVEARELAERALVLGRQADDPNAPLFVGIQREHSLYAQRRIDEMDRARLVEGGAASPAAAEWLVYVALIDAETGATEEARRLVGKLGRDDCSALAMDANWHGACVLADAAVLVADREAGAALYTLLEPHARLFPVVARAVGCLGSNEHYVGRLAGLLGRHDEAVARLRRAVAENDRAGAGPHAAAALLRLGETLTPSRRAGIGAGCPAASGETGGCARHADAVRRRRAAARRDRRLTEIRRIRRARQSAKIPAAARSRLGSEALGTSTVWHPASGPGAVPQAGPQRTCFAPSDRSGVPSGSFAGFRSGRWRGCNCSRARAVTAAMSSSATGSATQSRVAASIGTARLRSGHRRGRAQLGRGRRRRVSDRAPGSKTGGHTPRCATGESLPPGCTRGDPRSHLVPPPPH